MAEHVLDFIARITNSLAWPAFACLIVFILRKQMGGVFSRLTELKLPGEVSATFSDTMIEAKQAAKEAMSDEALLHGIKPEAIAARIFGPNHVFPSEDTVKTSTSVDPEEAVVRSFLEVDRALEKIFHRIYPKREFTDGSRFMASLRSENQVSDSVWRWFLQLRRLRNVAEHSPPGTLQSADAISYYRQCVEFAEFIDGLCRRNVLLNQPNPPAVGTDDKK